MKFKLLDQDRKPVHEGVAMRQKRPDVITWGNRAFVRDGETTLPSTQGGTVIVSYVEVDTFRIGGQ